MRISHIVFVQVNDDNDIIKSKTRNIMLERNFTLKIPRNENMGAKTDYFA